MKVSHNHNKNEETAEIFLHTKKKMTTKEEFSKLSTDFRRRLRRLDETELSAEKEEELVETASKQVTEQISKELSVIFENKKRWWRENALEQQRNEKRKHGDHKK